jgi:hypothetical protein
MIGGIRTSDFNNTKVVITRKPHKCGFCGTTIPKCQKVEYTSGIYDETWYNYYMCNFCNMYISEIDPDLDEGFDEYTLSEELDCIGLKFIDIDHAKEVIKFKNKNNDEITIKWNDFFEKYDL